MSQVARRVHYVTCSACWRAMPHGPATVMLSKLFGGYWQTTLRLCWGCSQTYLGQLRLLDA